jgi:hypothetical protein
MMAPAGRKVMIDERRSNPCIPLRWSGDSLDMGVGRYGTQRLDTDSVKKQEHTNLRLRENVGYQKKLSEYEQEVYSDATRN